MVINTSSDAVSEKLITRLLSIPYKSKGKVSFLLGKLPQMPVELPLPDDTHIIASISYGLNSFKIFLEIPLSIREVEVFFINRMRTNGWIMDKFTNPDNGEVILFHAHLQPGFARINETPHLSTPEGYLSFSNPAQRGSLMIEEDKTSAITQSTAIYLSLELDRFLSLSELFENNSSTALNSLPKPVLILPPETQVTYTRSWGSEGYDTSIVRMQTNLNQQQITTHYENKIKQAGWLQYTQKIETPLSWSLWHFKDSWGDVWKGLLYFLQLEQNSGGYIGYFKVFNLTRLLDGIPETQKSPISELETSVPYQTALRLLKSGLYLLDNTDILPRTIPPNLYNEIPLPLGTEIVVSIVTSEECIIILDVPLSAKQVLEFYKERLENFELQNFDLIINTFSKYQLIGFEESGFANLWRVFSHREQRKELLLTILPNYKGMTSVKINVNSGDKVRYGDKSEEIYFPFEESQLLPIPNLALHQESYVFETSNRFDKDVIETNNPFDVDSYEGSVVIHTQLSYDSLF